jgi:hypothetical protein
MVRYLRSLAAISTLVLASPLFAHADSILLGSYGTSAVNPGVINTSVAYDPTDSTVDTKATTTYNISPGSVWHAVLPNSSYISFNPNTAPGGSVIAPNGDYVYTVSFLLTPAQAAGVGSLTVLADDTVAVSLNNQLVLAAAPPLGPTNTYARCSDVGPNCLTPFTFSFTGLESGTNVLTFDVKQVNLSSEGLDFSGSITSPTSIVPEPASIALFGTGLFGIYAFLRRRSSRR